MTKDKRQKRIWALLNNRKLLEDKTDEIIIIPINNEAELFGLLNVNSFYSWNH